MANLGAKRLILIDPRCAVDESAHQMAAGAQAPLKEVRVYSSWQEFYANEGEGLRIALTRRGGKRRRVDPFAEKLTECLQTSPPANIYLIFGPEKSGLDAEDLAFANWACHLPVYGEFASYNLAQAVLLTLFIARQQIPTSGAPPTTAPAAEPVQPFYFPDQLLRDWLSAMGFDIRARRASAYLTLRRLFLQNRPSRHEIQVLEAVLQQNVRKLRESSFFGAAEQPRNDN